MALILDTGPLVAMLDATDPDHERCTELIQGSTEQRVVPVCVLVEIEYLLRPWPQAFAALLAEFDSTKLSLLDLPLRWLLRAGELVRGYNATFPSDSSTQLSSRRRRCWASPRSPPSIVVTSRSCGRLMSMPSSLLP